MEERIKELQYSVEAFKKLCLDTKTALKAFSYGALSDTQKADIKKILNKLKDVE
tara:strand:+ start:324 stop:485 length:162 start_codon:yes stop_codon:yes gene_type:complete